MERKTLKAQLKQLGVWSKDSQDHMTKAEAEAFEEAFTATINALTPVLERENAEGEGNDEHYEIYLLAVIASTLTFTADTFGILCAKRGGTEAEAVRRWEALLHEIKGAVLSGHQAVLRREQKQEVPKTDLELQFDALMAKGGNTDGKIH